ncbi:MAG TPA: hypothetical protein VGD67_25860 [Pseudonocardiaceae bacterium]
MTNGTAVSAASWTLTPGGPVVASGGTVVIAGGTTGTGVTGTTVTARGWMNGGSGLSGTSLIDQLAFSFTNCGEPAGMTCQITRVGTVAFDATAHCSGVTTGNPVRVTLRCTGPFCAVSGCFGLIPAGDRVSISFTLTLSPSPTITSP